MIKTSMIMYWPYHTRFSIGEDWVCALAGVGQVPIEFGSSGRPETRHTLRVWIDELKLEKFHSFRPQHCGQRDRVQVPPTRRVLCVQRKRNRLRALRRQSRPHTLEVDSVLFRAVAAWSW